MDKDYFNKFKLLSHTRLKHILWNKLESEGYEVGSEVKVVNNQDKNRIYNILKSKGYSIYKYYFDEEHGISQSLKSLSTKIDLVAIKDGKVTGYEIKNKFEDFANENLDKQIEAYKNGNMLDEIYLVIPSPIEHRVLSSYHDSIKKLGVGMKVINENLEIEERLFPTLLNKLEEPTIKYNEDTLRHEIWNYLEKNGFQGKEYDIDGEAYVLDSKLGKAHHPFYKIDLCLLPKGKDLTYVIENIENAECIGIEIGLKLGKLKDLEKYANSGTISRLYLALPKNKVTEAKKLMKLGEKFGLLSYDINTHSLEVEKDAPKFEVKYDGFVYSGMVWKFGFSTPINPLNPGEVIEERFSNVIEKIGGRKVKYNYHKNTTLRIKYYGDRTSVEFINR